MQRTFVNGCARFAWRGTAIASPPAPFVTAFHGFVTRATTFVTTETMFVTAETPFVTAETTRRLDPLRFARTDDRNEHKFIGRERANLD